MFGWVRKMLPLAPGPANMLGGITRSTVDPPKRGTLEHLQVYEAAPWARAVGDKVSTAVANCEFKLMAVTRGGRKVQDSRLQRAPGEVRTRALRAMSDRHEAQEITEHAFLSALDSPNPYMDRAALLKLTELHLDFVGDAFWLKGRNGLGAPVEFWPIPPQWVVETPRVDKPEFRFSYRAWQATVPASEVQWFHEAAPADPYTRGTGIGWSLGDEIQVDEYAAKMAAAFFFNRARPDFVFVTGMDTEGTKRLEMDWNSRLQGFWRAHRPYFLEGEADLQKQIREFAQPTMEQLVYPNLRKVQRDIILQVWGVPPEMFGIVENSNRATIEASEYLFTKWVVAPKAERLRGALQRMFVEDYDPRGIVHVESPVMEDKVHALNVAKAAPWALTVDEWRALVGLKAEGGDLGKARMVPMNSYVTVDPLDPKTRPQTTPAKPPGAEEDKPEASAEDEAKKLYDSITGVQ